MIFSLGGLRSRYSFGLVAALLALAFPGRSFAQPAAGDAILADAADVASDAGIYDVPAGGGSATVLTGTLSHTGGGVALDTPQFVAVSPAGAVYYIEGLAGGTANNIIRVDSAGTRSVVTTIPFAAPTGMVWDIATSHLLVSDAGTSATTCAVYSVDPSTGTALTVSAPSRSSNPVGTGPMDLPRFVAVSPSGAIYYFETGQSATNGVVAIDTSGNCTFLGAGPTAPTGMSWDASTGQLLISYAGTSAGSAGLALFSVTANSWANVVSSGVAYNLPVAATAPGNGLLNYFEQPTNQLIGVTAGVRAAETTGFTAIALTGLADVPSVPPQITGATTATAEVGSAFSYTIVATSSPTSYTETGTLPTGISFDTTAGAFSGTPTQTGSFPVTLGAVNGSGTGTASLTITVNPALSVSSASLAGLTAGSARSQTITFSGGTAPYTALAITNFSGGGTGLLAGAITANVGAGSFTLSGTATTVGTISFTAKVTDTAGFTLSQNYSVTVSPGAAAHFAVSAPGTATSGTSFSATVTAQDADNNTATGYSGTVHFTSSDGAAILPADATLTNGTGTFSFTAQTAGTQTITATDTATSSLTGTSGSITVGAGAATHLAVSAPATAGAGVAGSVSVTALDAANNTVTSYGGTVTLTSSDPQAALPAASPLVNGTQSFSVTLKTAGNQTVTANDGVLSAAVSGSIAVSPAAASGIGIAANPTATAGVSLAAAVTAHDAFGNLATGYAGTIKITSSDSAAVLPSNSALTSGAGSFAVTLKTAGSKTITATDTVNGALSATTNAIVVSPAATSALVVSAPGTATAGTAITVTVTAHDPFGNVTPAYAGTVAITSTDANAGLPASSALTNGTLNFSVNLKTAGTKTITATDTANSSLTGTSGNVVVGAGATTQFKLTAPGTAIANSAISVGVTAQDAQGNTTPGYAGTVHFTSTDGAAVLPANSTLTNGLGSFSVTLKTGGSKTVTATDTVNSALTGTSGGIAVGAGAATQLVVSTVTSTVAGATFDVTVIAQDSAGNTVTGYLGMVHFTKTDAGAASGVPANYQFLAADNGVHVFAAGAKLVTAGSQTITATDTVTGSITGTSSAITVTSAATSNFLVSVPANTVSGASFSASVTARDAFGNLTSAYAGTVKITLSDGAATPPANGTLTNGAGTFSVTLKTAGSQTVTATDTVNSALTGSASTSVAAGAASQLAISAPTTATAGAAIDFIVTAKDAAGNTAAGYRGTVHFTTTDGGSVTLPSDYTFLVADAGVHTFAAGAILATAGNQTLTVTDTVSSALTATTDPIAVSAGGTTHFRVVAPGSAIAGSAISVAVTALDAFNNTVPTYSGTVHLTSSDGLAVLPSDGPLSGGTATLTVTLKTAGSSTVSAVDAAASSITGVSSAVAVAPAAASSFTVTSSASVNALSSFTVTVTARDAFANVATGYAGTVKLTSSDPLAVLPANAALPVGTGTFTVTLKTAGAKTVTATDTVTSSIAGTSSAITVNGLTASIMLSGLEQTYTGSGLAVSTATAPVGLNVAISYNGSGTPPSAAGSYPVSAAISDPSYAGTATGTLVIDKAPATVALGGLTAVYNGGGKAATATTTPTGLGVSFSYLNSASQAVTAPTLAGTYSITAVITDANYTGTATGTLTITQASQTITFNPVGAASIGSPIALFATASSGLPVQFSVVSGNATVSGSTLVLADGSPVTVQATQNGNGNYFAAPPVSQTTSATKLSQTITVGTLPASSTQATPFDLNATASSGLPVSYAITSNNGTLNGSRVTPTGGGTLTIVISQAGNAIYSAAPSLTVTVPITQIGVRTFFGTFTVTAASSSVGAGPHAAATLSGTIAASINATNTAGTIIGTVGGSGFVLNFSIAADGSFSGVTTAQTGAGSTVTGSLTFAGNLTGNVLSGTIAELNTSFSVTADPVTGTSANVAGFYQAPALDAASGATYSMVGSQGEVFVLAVTPTGIAAGSGTLAAGNTFVVTTAQLSTVTGTVNAVTTAVTATVTTSSGTTTSYSGLASTTVPTDRLGNLSFLGTVSGANPMVSGFVIGGTAPKNVLLRAIGPGLTGFGLTGVLGTPELKVYDTTGAVLADNTGWGNSTTLAAAFVATGAFSLAANSSDAAVLLTLPTGSYSVQVTSDVAGASGSVLAEIYDADLTASAPIQRLLNISNLGMVTAGSGAVSAGFVVTGNTPKTVLIRGIGPTLAAFGVKGPLADPELTVYNQSGAVIGMNNDWSTGLAALAGQVTASAADIDAADVKTGAFALPAGSKDAAVILTLAPGLYTATVTGNGGTGGTALVEIYEISQ